MLCTLIDVMFVFCKEFCTFEDFVVILMTVYVLIVCLKYYRKARLQALSRTHPELYSTEVIVSSVLRYYQNTVMAATLSYVLGNLITSIKEGGTVFRSVCLSICLFYLF